jgi:hypothetical protein
MHRQETLCVAVAASRCDGKAGLRFVKAKRLPKILVAAIGWRHRHIVTVVIVTGDEWFFDDSELNLLATS